MYDVAMLPKINYMSMVMDSADSSGHIDSLAMKYLSDDQLSQLAQLRMTSPSKSNDRDPVLDRVMASSTNSSSNVTMYGMHDNNMSFATKKYMERYGLVPNSGERKEEDTSSPNVKDGNKDILNVKQFLEQLANKSLLVTPTKNRKQCRYDGGRYDDAVGSCGTSYTSESRSSSEIGSTEAAGYNTTCANDTGRYTEHISESFNDLQIRHTSKNPRYISTTSDTTQYYSPDNRRRLQKNVEERLNNTDPEPNYERILDIERLKVLPKLL